MAEEITFTAPVQTDAGASRFRVAKVIFDWETASISITLREWNGTAFFGRTIFASYEGAVATTLMQGLNKANLSAGNSLHQRIITRLTADGKIPAGTQTGSPD